VNAVPILGTSDAPSTRDLSSQGWALVRSFDRWYLGRLTAESEAGLLRLADPFEYRSEYVVDQTKGRIGLRVQIFVIEMLPGLDEIAVLPGTVIRLDGLTDAELASIATHLRAPWDARKSLRRATSTGLVAP
jgi:hypothetical protein